MWAIKIFNDISDEDNLDLLNFAKENRLGVEVACYKPQPLSPVINDFLKTHFSSYQKALHLSHSKYCVFDWILKKDLAIKQELFINELAIANAFQARVVIIHLSNDEKVWESVSTEQVQQALIEMSKIAKQYNCVLCLEKTFESLAWFQEFMNNPKLLEHISNLGFVFDVGHSYVWKRQDLYEWLDWIEKIQKKGFTLHFHVHLNEGNADTHTDLKTAFELGWFDNLDPKWCASHFVDYLKKLDQQFDDKVLLVLENASHLAKPNVNFLRFICDS